MGEVLHFLDGLRCPSCHQLNAQWLDPLSGRVDCEACGQTSLSVPEQQQAGDAS